MTTLLSAPGIARRPAVSLEELNGQAELLTRVDRKYTLAAGDAADFVAAFGGGVGVLEIDGRRVFGYRSTYYDTPDSATFLDAARRRRNRYKVRVRHYLDSGACFLEVKTRRGGATVKTRRPWTPTAGLTGEGMAFVRSTLADAGIAAPESLAPRLDVTYRRSTYLLPDGAGRLTHDSYVGWLDLDNGRHCGAPELHIIETKTGARPSCADRALWRAGQRPTAISKYATGLAILRPSLPRNRWHRLLDSPPLTTLLTHSHSPGEPS